ncbi:hypothetical protein BRYFOR_06854 [Marvinbryantia formatexigens DSM 14469]|uniref:Uncharacterized protein n=1 Tax=Marvinbryantia formatexigens DSM 14469 TaxID=478749 RepID=C6LE05_9FIRM|nr:hypothetical protein BRYFOR_06854 [Marvinbryantia formatexigens DSM 14469]
MTLMEVRKAPACGDILGEKKSRPVTFLFEKISFKTVLLCSICTNEKNNSEQFTTKNG